MRLSRMLLAGLAAVSMAVLVPGPASATDTGPSRVLDVQVSPDSVDVFGLGSAVITVRMHLTDPDGVKAGLDGWSELPWPDFVVSTRAETALRDSYAYPMVLESGTERDGWWRFDIHVGAAFAGSRRLVAVHIRDSNGNVTGVSLDRSFDVHVTGAPRLSVAQKHIGFAEDETVTVGGRAYRADTGAPIVGARLTLDDPEFGCGRYGEWGMYDTATDANGYWTHTFRRTPTQDPYWLGLCVGPTSAAAADDKPYEHAVSYLRWFHTRYRYHLSASLARASTGVGGSVAVSGSIFVKAGLGLRGELQLQRWSNKQWRTVARSYSRENGRYAMNATPPFAGRHLYRVLRYEPASSYAVSTASPAMTLTAY